MSELFSMLNNPDNNSRITARSAGDTVSYTSGSTTLYDNCDKGNLTINTTNVDSTKGKVKAEVINGALVKEGSSTTYYLAKNSFRLVIEEEIGVDDSNKIEAGKLFSATSNSEIQVTIATNKDSCTIAANTPITLTVVSDNDSNLSGSVTFTLTADVKIDLTPNTLTTAISLLSDTIANTTFTDKATLNKVNTNVGELKTAIGDSTGGLAKDIKDLNTTISNTDKDTPGLIQKIDELKSVFERFVEAL